MNIDGPMLIIAGAGTGKTKVITSRIAYLMLEKGVDSDNIAALTFTEKASEEMTERLDQMMPYSYQEVEINTFHGFCDFLLREKGHEIGLDGGYKLLDQNTQWFFLKRNLYHFELDYYRPLGNPNKHIGQLAGHFSRLKDEDISPETYVSFAESKMSSATDEISREEAHKMLEIAKMYQKYQQLLIENGFMDFGDLQYYALRLLEKRPSVLNHYQNRFRYILVDEFQDTNYAQYKLVSMLAKGHQNLTVVGDDDQSIYKWRGASLTNMVSFGNDFPGAKKVVLTENYRSGQHILDASYALIQNNNPQRLETKEGIVKKLISNKPEFNEKVKVWHFESYIDESDQIVSKIQQYVNEGGSYNDIAILVRTNNLSNVFIETFEREGVPFVVRDTQGLLRLPEIKDMLALISFLTNTSNDIALTRLLLMRIFDIQVKEILLLVKEAKSKYIPLFYRLKSFADIDDTQQSLAGFESTAEGFERFYRLMNRILELSRESSISTVIYTFLKESRYFESLTNEDTSANVEKLQNIGAFLELARKFETEEADNSMRHFADYLDLMEKSEQILSPVSREDSNAVSVLTVHSAKGLEFDLVFIPSVVKSRFPQNNRADAFNIPDELICENIPEDNLHLNEERRLFYVACTRARKELILSYSDKYEGPKKWKKSNFIDEIMASGQADEVIFSGKDKEFESSKNNAIESEKSDVVDFSQDEIKKISYSQLNTFETCPLRYKFQYLWKIPAPSAHALNFGSSVHGTVNKFYENVIKGEEPNEQLIASIFEENWISEGYESRSHMTHSKQKGMEMMQRFYQVEKNNGFRVPEMMEQLFILKLDGLTFRGRIDRIDKLPDGTYEIVDYKTGSSKRDTNLKKDKQLFLYALACRDYFRIPVSKMSLYYLDDCSKASVNIKDMDLDKLYDEIVQSIADLRKSSFEATPGRHCRFCEFNVMCNSAE